MRRRTNGCIKKKGLIIWIILNWVNVDSLISIMEYLYNLKKKTKYL